MARRRRTSSRFTGWLLAAAAASSCTIARSESAGSGAAAAATSALPARGAGGELESAAASPLPGTGDATNVPEGLLPGVPLANEGGSPLPGSGTPAVNGAEPGAPASPDAGGASTLVSGLPPQSEVLAMLRLANAQLTRKWPDPSVDIVTDRARPSNLWTRAVYFEGLMGLYAVEPDAQRKAQYYDYAVRWGESPTHPWQVTYGAVDSSDADAQACGQTYLDLYAIEPEPVRIQQIEANVRNLIATGDTSAWWWIDALQMAMPVFTRLGVLRNDPSFFEAMFELYSYTRDSEGGGLLDDRTGLWWRDADFTPGGTYTLSATGQDIYWSRGNGWVLAALARTLDALPANEPHRPTYEADFRALAAALLPLQRADGFWSSSVANPLHCQSAGQPGEDGPEASGTALFAYGFGWGIRSGLLDSATYGPALVNAWNGLSGLALRDDGFLGFVQSTGSAPCSDPGPLGADVAPNFEDYGVGCFLLAGSEILRASR